MQLVSDCRWIYFVYYKEACCAFFYVDKHEDETYETSSSGVLSEYMGKGIGTYALAMQFAEIKQRSNTGKVFSWVSNRNIASYKRYENLGFIRTEEFEVRHLPLLGNEHRFYKWIKEL